MATVALTATVDLSRLNRAIELAKAESSRSLEKIVLDTAYQVAQKAQAKTPHVPLSRIDSELGTAIVLQKKLRGKGFKRRKRDTLYMGGRKVMLNHKYSPRFNDAKRPVPLVAAIINASVVNPVNTANRFGYSNYNTRTNFRFARTESPFKGKTLEVGRAAMRAAEHRKISRRHSSTHFLVAGWSAVVKKILAKIHRRPAGSKSSHSRHKFKDSFGEFTVTPYGTSINAVLENMIGCEAGERGDNSANYNEALHRYGGPAAQEAVDEQAAEMDEHSLQKIYVPELVAQLQRHFA